MTAYSHFIWYEKYRPKAVGDMVLSADYREIFTSYITDQNIPHLLLYGPPASGKTTMAMILIENLPAARLILNASSKDRGIDAMKTKVRDFAGAKPGLGKTMKIVLLDEADGLTMDAQKSLKNTIETFSKTCRFIFTANNVDQINSAIFSRCTPFQLSEFPKRRMLRNLMHVLEKEEISYERKDLQDLLERFYPDYRTILNFMQAGSVTGSLHLRNIAALDIDPARIIKLINGGFIKELRKMWAGSTEFMWLYKLLFDQYVPNIDNEEVRATCALIVAEHASRDALVVDREMQFASCCVSLMVEQDINVTF